MYAGIVNISQKIVLSTLDIGKRNNNIIYIFEGVLSFNALLFA